MVLVNGSENSGIDPADRGLSYGDGLFETMAVSGGRPLAWDAHLERLNRGCLRLGIPRPDPAVLAEEAARVCDTAGRGVLKLILSRGSGGRGYIAPQHPHPTRVLALHPWPDYPRTHYRDGVTVRICETRLGRNSSLAGLKHLNRLEQVLARAEWSTPDIAEGLMLDDEGHVIEGTMSNLFVVRDGCLLTPELDECGVAGVVRAKLLQLAPSLALQTRVARLGLADVLEAQEVFLTNSIIGIWSVRAVATGEGRSYTAADVAGRLRGELEAAGATVRP